MKKLIIVLQILVLLSTHVTVAADGQPVAPAQTEILQKIIPEVPKNYRLPDMLLLDSVAFYTQFKDNIGRRISVEGYTGRFGVTWGEEFRQKVFEIERMNEEKVEIILTLSSTIEDAKILKQRMGLVGRKMVIVEIPDEIQKKYLERAQAKASGGLKELWWDVKDTTEKLIHPIKTVSNTKNIIKNQFVKPTREDLALAKISIAATVVNTGVATAAAIVFGVGVDPTLLISMAAARIFIGGTTMTYHRTITNLFRSDITDEFNIITTKRQIATRLSVLGLGISEAYYALGSSIAGSAYGLTQEQLVSNTATSGLVETAATVERNKRLSKDANHRMIVYTIMLGSLISTFSTLGIVGPLVMEYGVFQLSSLQVTTIAIFSGLFLAYKYKSMQVERIAQHDLKQIIVEKYNRLLRLRIARAERLERERENRVRNRELLMESIKDWNMRGGNLVYPKACSKLFQ